MISRNKQEIKNELTNLLFALEDKLFWLGYNSEDNPDNDKLREEVNFIQNSILQLFDEITNI